MKENILGFDETDDIFDDIFDFDFDDEASEPGEYDDDDIIFFDDFDDDDKANDYSDNEDSVTDPPGTHRCNCCNEILHGNDYYNDGEIRLCNSCSHCSDCNTLMRQGGWEYNGHYYCYPCMQTKYEKKLLIHTYKYKPAPIFYGDRPRYFGVELEIDGAGKNTDNADKILTLANKDSEHIYIKTDNSLEDGMEIVSHPMTLDYHKQFQWDK